MFEVLGLFDLKTGELGNLLYVAAAVAAYFVVMKLGGNKKPPGPTAVPADGSAVQTTPTDAQPSTTGIFGRLAERAANLIQHGASLGLPLQLMALVKDVAAGNWLKVPGDANALFDALDSKETRGFILDEVFAAQLQRQLGNPARLEALTRTLDAAGFVVTKKST